MSSTRSHFSWTKVFCILVLTVVLSSCSIDSISNIHSRDSSQLTCQEKIQYGEELFDSNSRAASQSIFRAVERECSQDIGSLIKLGIVYFKKGFFENSSDVFLDVINKDKKNSKAYYNLGVLYSSDNRHKDFSKARKYFGKYLELEPGSEESAGVYQWLRKNSPEDDSLTKSLKFIGLDQYKNNQLEPSRDNLEKYLKQEEDDVDAHFTLGLIYYKMGQLEKSRYELLTAVSLDENHVKSYYNLGIVYSDLKNKEKAAFFFKKYLNLEPQSPLRNEISSWIKENGISLNQ